MPPLPQNLQTLVNAGILDTTSFTEAQLTSLAGKLSDAEVAVLQELHNKLGPSLPGQERMRPNIIV